MPFGNLVVNMPPFAVAEMIIDIISIDYPYQCESYGYKAVEDGVLLAAHLRTPEISEYPKGIFHVKVDADIIEPWEGCTVIHSPESRHIAFEPGILSFKIFPYRNGQSKLKIYSFLSRSFTDLILHELKIECGTDDSVSLERFAEIFISVLRVAQKESTMKSESIDSGHYNFTLSKRDEIVEQYFEDRAAGKVVSKAGWVTGKGLSARTLTRYINDYNKRKKDT